MAGACRRPPENLLYLQMLAFSKMNQRAGIGREELASAVGGCAVMSWADLHYILVTVRRKNLHTQTKTKEDGVSCVSSLSP